MPPEPSDLPSHPAPPPDVTLADATPADGPLPDVTLAYGPLPDVTVAYGPLPDQVVDVWFAASPSAGRGSRTGPDGDPAGTARALVIVIHGGFWRAAYDRVHTRPLTSALAAQGWPVAAIEYRRVGQPGGGWPGTLDDVSSAIGRTPELVRDAHTVRDLTPPDGSPILLGHSAGGQLALWYAATAHAVTTSTAGSTAGASATTGTTGNAGATGTTGNAGATGDAGVRAVLALAPVADLLSAYDRQLGAGAVADLLGGGPAEVPERYAEADPCARVPLSVPVVLVHGDLDIDVPIELSRAYAAAAASAGATVTLVELAGMEHFSVIDPQSAAWGAVMDGLRSCAGVAQD